MVVALPESLCPDFPVIAVGIKGAAPYEATDRFIEFPTGPEAQSILRCQGPEACPICDGEKCVPSASAPGGAPTGKARPHH